MDKRSKTDNYWQSSMNSQEKARHLFDSNKFFDCEFLVGCGNDKQVRIWMKIIFHVE